LKQQVARLIAQLEREVLRADNLQHQFDIIRLERLVAEQAAASSPGNLTVDKSTRQEHGFDKS
jgi:hypothetical protein